MTLILSHHMTALRRGLAAWLKPMGRHRTALSVAAASLAGAAVLLGVVVGFTGAQAQADTPRPSQGGRLTVVMETRPAPEPAPTTTYTLLPTLAANMTTQPVSLDPDLVTAQSLEAVQRDLDREAHEQDAALAEIARVNARAEQTLSQSPTWPSSPGPSPAPLAASTPSAIPPN